MELPFEKTVCRYWKQKLYTLQRCEETQEMRLTDAMPDIGHVIASWGQVVMRGKDWRPNGLTVSGGVMVWVLYAPADGGAPKQVETWVPFQMKADYQDQGPDGVIRAECILRGVDARNTSPRKLMLRVGVGAMIQALAPEQAQLYGPGELPADIEVLNRTYPMVLTRETGEKAFLADEELELPDPGPKPEKLIYYRMEPRVLEQKVMGSRAVFRGMGQLHVLYMDGEEKLRSADLSVPFAQYMELDGVYEEDASVSNLLAVTSLELELTEEGKLRLKCGMVSQYIINAQSVIRILEDAYSPCRKLEEETEELLLPAWLDSAVQEAELSAQIPGEDLVGVDQIFFPDLPELTRRPDGVAIRAGGTFQTIMRDQNGRYTGSTQKTGHEIVHSTSCDTVAFPVHGGQAAGRQESGGWRVETKVALNLESICTKPLRMISSLQAGEYTAPDPDRPSVIIRARRENESLWDIAKYCGSTVSAIQRMNKLESEPEENCLLLIPVI